MMAEMTDIIIYESNIGKPVESVSPEKDDSKGSEPSTSQTDTSEDSSHTRKIPESPKPLAFTIDFGERKTIDTNRFKNIFEKYQNRHRRGKSLSKIESKEPVPKTVPKPPSSVNFPRKADYHSEGYFSSDQEDKTDPTFIRKLKGLGLKSGPMSAVKRRTLKNDMTLPLQNTTVQRLNEPIKQHNFDLLQITSPEIDLKDISSPELDLLTPSDPTPNVVKSMPELNFSIKKSPGLLKNSTDGPNSFKKKEVKDVSVTFQMNSSTESITSPQNTIKNNTRCGIRKQNTYPVGKNVNRETYVLCDDYGSPETFEVPIDGYRSTNCEKTVSSTYEILDLDRNSDSVSEAGTYTLDADNYTEEQKARMSIDKEFGIETDVDSVRMTQKYVESTLHYVSNNKVEEVSSNQNKLNKRKNYISMEESVNLKPVVVKNINTEVQYVRPNLKLEDELRQSCCEIVQNQDRSENRYISKKSARKMISPQQSIGISEPNNAVVENQPTAASPHLVRKTIILNNIDSLRKNEKNTNKILFASKKSKNSTGLEQVVDEGCFTSITTCGVFKRDQNADSQASSVANNSPVDLSPEHGINSRKNSLTKNEIYHDNNLVNVYSNRNVGSISIEDVVNVSPKSETNDKKPPLSPTKIPSPIQSSLWRPKSRASLDLSDSSVETDCYLKHTQNVITSLQAKITSDQSKKYDQRKIAQNLIKNQTKHVRHNSFDSKNTHSVTNKLENFQTKNFQPNIDQTLSGSQNQCNIQRNVFTGTTATRSPTHKLYNAPNNSPIRRSSSFSVKHMQNQLICDDEFNQPIYINSPVASPRIIQKESNLNRNSPNLNRNDGSKVHRSSSTASIKNHLNPFRRHSANSPDRINLENNRHSSNESIHQKTFENRHGSSSESVHKKIDRNQFRSPDSSSDDEFINDGYVKTKENGIITNTRHNRAFSLRRARLDLEPPTSKCPNTPEMRRKFVPGVGSDSNKRGPVRSISSEPKKTTDVQSRYMNIAKANAVPKMSGKTIPNNNPNSMKNVPQTKTAPVTKPSVCAIRNPVMARTDSGRFSIRTSKPKPSSSTPKNTSKKGNRSNSSLTSREVEFQNWKRRKSYDPMKAAAEGRKKAEMSKKINQNNSSNSMTQSYTEASQDCDSSPSHSSSVHRSQSFHGTGGLDNYISSEDELTLSADDMEGITPPAPTPSNSSPIKTPNISSVKSSWYQKRY